MNGKKVWNPTTLVTVWKMPVVHCVRLQAIHGNSDKQPAEITYTHSRSLFEIVNKLVCKLLTKIFGRCD